MMLAAIGVLLFSAGFAVGRGVSRSPESVAHDNVGNLVAQVGEIFQLPEGEEPSILTVTDMAQLADNPFFAGAKIGDKVLVYAKAGIAILYDPTARQIVRVGPFSVTQ